MPYSVASDLKLHCLLKNTHTKRRDYTCMGVALSDVHSYIVYQSLNSSFLGRQFFVSQQTIRIHMTTLVSYNVLEYREKTIISIYKFSKL